MNLPVKPKATDLSLVPHIDGVLQMARGLESSKRAIRECHRSCTTNDVGATREARHRDQERHRRASSPRASPD